MGVTIRAVPTAGGPTSTITIDKTGASTGTINIDGTNYDVYDVKVRADDKKLVCKTKKFFFTITVTVEVLAAQAANAATVSVTIAGAPFGNGTTNYSITVEDETKLTQFFADSNFPVLA
jgi:hypothetical protein